MITEDAISLEIDEAFVRNLARAVAMAGSRRDDRRARRKAATIPQKVAKYDARLGCWTFSKGNANQPRVEAGNPDGGEWTSGGSMVGAHKDREKWPAHIKALKIPPAYVNVRINPDPNADLQALADNSKGKTQYYYKEEFKAAKQDEKFERVRELEREYPAIEKEVIQDLRSKDEITQQHAECLHLVMQMGVRPGSETDTKADEQAYGATTLEGRHVFVDSKDNVKLRFTGKDGVKLNLPVEDQRVAGILRTRAEAAGKDGQLWPDVTDKGLLQYIHALNATDNRYKTKDFRTLLANKLAKTEINSMKRPTNEKEYKAAVKSVAVAVSSKLGNTPAVALKAYIHGSCFAPWRSKL